MAYRASIADVFSCFPLASGLRKAAAIYISKGALSLCGSTAICRMHLDNFVMLLSLPLLTIAASTALGWNFVQNGTTGLLALEAIVVSPTLAILFDFAGTGSPGFTIGSPPHPAWGAFWNFQTNRATAIPVASDTFCASAGHLSNGSMVSIGGSFFPGSSTATDGYMALRIFEPCASPDGSGCTLFDNANVVRLAEDRWYPSAIRIFDGSLMIVGGTHVATVFYNTDRADSFEFFPRKDNGVVRQSRFLVRSGPANLFPRIFALPDGTVFMVAGNQSIIYNVETRTETILPDIPNGVRVTNPFDGTAVLLPLSPPDYAPEVLVCGGTTTSDRIPSTSLSSQDPASDQCSRIMLTPAGIARGWVVERMPERRVLSEMLLLPTGEVILLGGGQSGYAALASVRDPVGNSNADHPNLTPTLYNPNAPVGSRISKEGLPATSIPRLYHSTYTLTAMGNIFIAGSNPNPIFNTTVRFPTERRVEYLNPPYMSLPRPKLSGVPSKIAFNTNFTATLDLPQPADGNSALKVALMDLGYSSHAFHSSARLVWLDATLSNLQGITTLHIASPPNNRVYPPGPGYIFVTVGELTSEGAHVMIGSGASPPVPDQGRRI
ncbi:Copper radical oxidase [Mycena kentingensis (nom. inval.)]|nr:Copper radical oxidase [Mycena kentingensis (nom. inval.)]